MPFPLKNNIEKAVGMLTLSCIEESGSLLPTSVQCFCCLSFSKVLHMEYICLSVPVSQGKKGKEIKKRKITKKSINTCYSQICSYLGSEVPAGKVRTKNPRMSIYVFIDFLACIRFLNFILYLFHFVSSYFIPEWTLYLLLFYYPGFVLSNVYFLFPYMPYFVFSKVEIFFSR